MHVHPEGWDGRELPLGSHDGPCLLAHLKRWVLGTDFRWPSFLGPSLWSGNPNAPSTFQMCCFALIFDIFKKSLKFEKRWEGDGYFVLWDMSFQRHLSLKTLCPKNQGNWAHHIGPGQPERSWPAASWECCEGASPKGAGTGVGRDSALGF